VRVQIDARLHMNHKNGNAEGNGGYGYEQGYQYVTRLRFINVYQIQVCTKKKRKQEDG